MSLVACAETERLGMIPLLSVGSFAATWTNQRCHIVDSEETGDGDIGYEEPNVVFNVNRNWELRQSGDIRTQPRPQMCICTFDCSAAGIEGTRSMTCCQVIPISSSEYILTTIKA